MRDLTYAVRAMRRAPGFTAVVVLSLALGIGANTAIFTLINVLMLRPLPVSAPGQLVEPLKLYVGDPRLNAFPSAAYRYIRDHNTVFSGVLATGNSRITARGEDGVSETLDGEAVSGSYFPVLGLRPAAGRLIGPDDTASRVAVVSWAYWRNRFHLDPAVVGKRIQVGDTPATIIGVAPQGFSGVRMWVRTQIWVSGAEGGALIARLRPGVTREQATAQMASLFRQVQEQTHDPLTGRVTIELEPARAGMSMPILGDRFGKPLLALMALVALLLLLACANIGGMLLARGAAREREMAVRVSLGAGRWRLARQSLTEALALSTAGAAAAMFLAYFGAGALVRIIASGRRMPGIPQSLDISVQPDLRVFLYTAAIAILTGLLFGLAPALRAMGTAPAFSLSGGARAGESRRSRRFAAALVAGQVALSVVLLSAAGQFIERLSQLRNDVGFDREHLLLMSLEPRGRGFNRAQLSAIYRDVLERFEAIPGVRSATLCAPTPLSGAGASRFVTVEGHAERPEERRYVSLAWVAPKYFQTLGTPLLQGRDFSFQDQGRPRVAIINQAMARFYFGDRNPLGKSIRIDVDARTGGWYGGEEPYEVVGVVADSKYYEPGETTPRTLYFNAYQDERIQSSFVIRTSGSPSTVIAGARQAVAEVAKGIPVEGVTLMADRVDGALIPERLVALLSSGFGAIGAILAAIGLYGLLAFSVARRTNEIGIRMALGATQGSIGRMVLAAALKMSVAGLALGLPAAIGATRFAAHLVEGLPVGRPLPIATAILATFAVALGAAYFPARRAARLDPMDALRAE